MLGGRGSPGAPTSPRNPIALRQIHHKHHSLRSPPTGSRTSRGWTSRGWRSSPTSASPSSRPRARCRRSWPSASSGPRRRHKGWSGGGLLWRDGRRLPKKRFGWVACVFCQLGGPVCCHFQKTITGMHSHTGWANRTPVVLYSVPPNSCAQLLTLPCPAQIPSLHSLPAELCPVARASGRCVPGGWQLSVAGEVPSERKGPWKSFLRPWS